MENKKEMLLKAYREGKTIQSFNSIEWTDFVPQNQVDSPNFDYMPDNWRVKPDEIQPEDIWNEEKKKGIKKLILENTLEQAADNFSSDNYYASQSECFIAGANWQAERMYTLDEITEECIDNWLDYRIDNSSKISFKEWFKQFKKK